MMPNLFWYQPIWSGQKLFQGSRRIDRPTQAFDEIKIIHKVANRTAEAVILARAMEKQIASFLVGGLDPAGMASVLDAVGHEESFQEAMINFVLQNTDPDLNAKFSSLSKIESERKSPLFPKNSKEKKEVKRIPALALQMAEQTSLFGKGEDMNSDE